MYIQNVHFLRLYDSKFQHETKVIIIKFFFIKSNYITYDFLKIKLFHTMGYFLSRNMQKSHQTNNVCDRNEFSKHSLNNFQNNYITSCHNFYKKKFFKRTFHKRNQFFFQNSFGHKLQHAYS
jgi:hypothetical protein